MDRGCEISFKTTVSKRPQWGVIQLVRVPAGTILKSWSVESHLLLRGRISRGTHVPQITADFDNVENKADKIPIPINRAS